jgi:hypothetical protein
LRNLITSRMQKIKKFPRNQRRKPMEKVGAIPASSK